MGITPAQDRTEPDDLLRRALIVAEDTRRRAIIIERLAVAGFETRSAVCADGVSAAIAQGWPDIVVIDLTSPG